MRILVTGGSGFIGTRLVAELLAAGHEIRILDKICSAKYPRLCLVGDVRDERAVHAALKGVDLVFHLAAEHRDDVTPVEKYYDVNVGGTRKLAEACAVHGVSRIVFTSSVAVYGLDRGVPTEDTEPQPFNDYGKSKVQGEEVLRRWAAEHSGSILAIVRPTVIFGEGNRGNVYNLLKQIVGGRFVMIGAGTNRKSMGYVGNIASFLAYIGQSSIAGTAVYNYADKPDLTMNELVAFVRSGIGRQPGAVLRLPYFLGLSAGACFDSLGVLTGRKFPVSRIRVKKFCASTMVSVEKVAASGFQPGFSLHRGLENFLCHEFPERFQSAKAKIR